MTNHFSDFKNADVILAIGSNNAENHPVSMAWVQEARAKGAKYIVVDPRFTRSAALADIYAPLRSGTDIAFFGGLMKYIMDNGLWQKEYVENYTNATYLVKPEYNFDPETGMFSTWDEKEGKYTQDNWGYQIAEEKPWNTGLDPKTGKPAGTAYVTAAGVPKFDLPVGKVAKKDPTMGDPNCVWQRMRKHYERYTVEMVSRITGTPTDKLIEVWEAFAASGAPEKSGTILYAMGQTQHTYGSQNVRAMALVQMLLGNIGVAGGGINALRGEANVQGSTDQGTLANTWPAYLNTPTEAKAPTLAAYLATETPGGGFKTNVPKWIVSLLKEFWGENATVENDYLFDLMPKLNKVNHTHIGVFEGVNEGIVKGMMCWGQNPAVAGPNSIFEREMLGKLDWLLAVDLWETETAGFWKAPGVDPASIKTEVYMLPAAAHFEKQGSISNSGRWIQWRYKAVEPPGEARDDFEIMHELRKKLVELYQAEGGANPDQVLKLSWPYETDGRADITKVAQAMNGYTIADGKLVKNFTALKADGTTACGVWIYSGYFNNNDAPNDPTKQPTGSRAKDDPSNLGLHPQWSFSWPVNRRIVYNRASADVSGKPWNAEKMLVEWDGAKWKTNDVPDFAFKVTDPKDPKIVLSWTPPNNIAFLMNDDGSGHFFGLKGMKDGPFPEHYEPFETPVTNLMNGRQSNPALTFGKAASVKPSDPKKYPIVCSTYRMTEHWQTGGMTRNIPWLAEAMPNMFVEMSEELAKDKGIKNGDTVKVSNDRGSIEMYAMVTPRFKPFNIDGKTVHQVGMPWHWGYASGYATGAIANDITPNVGDANTSIPEYKAFLVNVEKA
jgi:formate dehydrogenase major subunit